MENNSNNNELIDLKDINISDKVPQDCTNVSLIDGCILEPEQYNFLWATSWLTLPTAICAYYNKHYLSSALSTCILLTSLNYWRKPVRGFSRNLDMVTSYFSIGLHLLTSTNAQYARIYYPMALMGLSCYPIGNYYYNKKKYWLSTYFHGGLHFIANLSHTILFCGKMEQFRYVCLY